MKYGKVLLELAGSALAVCALSAYAYTAASGRVVRVIGAAEVVRSGSAHALKKDDVLQSGDSLRTPVDGRLQWWMQDDAVAVIATQSQAQLRSFDADAGESLYQIERGGMRVIAGQLSPKVLTPRATVTARNADFSTIVCDARCGKDAGHVYVYVTDGSVRVQNTDGSIEAKAGQIVQVASPPTIVVNASAAVQQLIVELSLGIDIEIPKDFIPNNPLTPIPPVEPPGSPS